MRRRLLTGAIGLGVLAGISTWLFTAEASGPVPPGYYEASVTPDWPLSAARGEAIRDDALRRAAVTLESAAVPLHQAGAGRHAPDVLPCQYIRSEPTGTSAKFDCVLDGGDVVKVKYSRNPEIQAEAAATRLLTALGYPADEVTIVRTLRCYGCPRFPFFAMQLLALTSATERFPLHGHSDAYTDFEWVAVERKFPAAAIETARQEGWAWFELERSEAPRADLDALRLLAVFLAHWDNKSSNQRLVCLDPVPASPDHPCGRPLAMIQDLGSTFGPTKVNLARWRATPVWADRRRCTVTMRGLPFEGATFPDARISEEGRRQLAARLAAIDAGSIRTLFRDARFADYHSATDDERDLDAWTGAFRHRVDQIVSAGPCPPAD